MMIIKHISIILNFIIIIITAPDSLTIPLHLDDSPLERAQTPV